MSLRQTDLWASSRTWFVVADGMGGHQAGDYASKYTVEVLQRELKMSEGEDVEKCLVAAIKTANREIIKERPAMNISGEWARQWSLRRS